jgi:hypothetical protein
MTASRDLNMINEIRCWWVVKRSAYISSRLDGHICEAPIYLGVATHKKGKERTAGGT